VKRARLADISYHQGSFKFLGNLDGIIVKATEGVWYDPEYINYLDEVLKVPVRGSYHYYRTSEDPIVQAKYFDQWTRDQGFHFLAGDYEAYKNTLDRKGAENYLLFLLELEKLTDLPIFIYTSPYIYRDNLRVWSEEFDRFPFWIARWKYSDADVADPTKSLFGDDLQRSWDIWQYTSTGDGSLFGVGSISIDLSVYNGTAQEMKSRFIQEIVNMKKFWQSKTFWFFLLALIISVANAFGFAGFIPEEAYGEVGVAIISVIGIILRFFTREGIEP